MNKISRILILIGLAGGIIFLLHFFSTENYTAKKESKSTNGVVKDFETQCDTLGNLPWNTIMFQIIRNKLQMYRDQKAISGAEATSLENYLQVSYAKSLRKSCDLWKNNKCSTSINSVYNEMKIVATNIDCKNVLNSSIVLIQTYNEAIKLPARANYFTTNEYSENGFAKLISDINKLCNTSGINLCPTIQKIKREQTGGLNEFKKFAINYNQQVKVWTIDPQTYAYAAGFKDLCPDDYPEIIQYTFYYKEIISLDLCNKSFQK